MHAVRDELLMTEAMTHGLWTNFISDESRCKRGANLAAAEIVQTFNH